MSGFKSRHDHAMEKLATALDSDDLGTMIDALLTDVNDEYSSLASIGGGKQHIDSCRQRLALLVSMRDLYAAMTDKAADDRFNASIASAMSWEGHHD
jgi:glycine cleavage system regulatory protein